MRGTGTEGEVEAQQERRGLEDFCLISRRRRPGSFRLTRCALVVAAAVSSLKMQGDFSDAVPFLKRPINLDGEYAGDVGFDPLVSFLCNRWARSSYSMPSDTFPQLAPSCFHRRVHHVSPYPDPSSLILCNTRCLPRSNDIGDQIFVASRCGFCSYAQ